MPMARPQMGGRSENGDFRQCLENFPDDMETLRRRYEGEGILKCIVIVLGVNFPSSYKVIVVMCSLANNIGATFAGLFL